MPALRSNLLPNAVLWQKRKDHATSPIRSKSHIQQVTSSSQITSSGPSPTRGTIIQTVIPCHSNHMLSLPRVVKQAEKHPTILEQNSTIRQLPADPFQSKHPIRLQPRQLIQFRPISHAHSDSLKIQTNSTKTGEEADRAGQSGQTQISRRFQAQSATA
jgi:hypothetical protein